MAVATKTSPVSAASTSASAPLKSFYIDSATDSDLLENSNTDKDDNLISFDEAKQLPNNAHTDIMHSHPPLLNAVLDATPTGTAMATSTTLISPSPPAISLTTLSKPPPKYPQLAPHSAASTPAPAPATTQQDLYTRSTPCIPLPASTIAANPPLSTYLKSTALRISSFTLSLGFLTAIASAAIISHIPVATSHVFHRLTFRDRNAKVRPFYDVEKANAQRRKDAVKAWKAGIRTKGPDGFAATEGGEDLVVCDVGYYARRVGLDSETIQVTTDDGFIIELWHIFDPKVPRGTRDRPSVKYPVLLVHGLLQSSGTFCVNDDNSLAFDLCKSGYDVWLGNNRCGFNPRHTTYKPSDPRMWSWDIREMATLDLPSLVGKVLAESGHETLGLIAHSQGTAQSLLALSRDKVPDLSQKISVVCVLAPAAYAGPLVRKPWFRFMSTLPRIFWCMTFGIHEFIPIMMLAHRYMPTGIYGNLSYIVFSFLFGWTDRNWDRGLRARMFQFSPVHVSSGLIAWWLGRGGFAHYGSIIQNAAEDPDADVTPADAEANAWYPPGTPPFALWICEHDSLVDGGMLLRRLKGAREPWARVAFAEVLAGYEHLDVLWAVDARERVNVGVRKVVWECCPVKGECVVPRGCDETEMVGADGSGL